MSGEPLEHPPRLKVVADYHGEAYQRGRADGTRWVMQIATTKDLQELSLLVRAHGAAGYIMAADVAHALYGQRGNGRIPIDPLSHIDVLWNVLGKERGDFDRFSCNFWRGFVDAAEPSSISAHVES